MSGVRRFATSALAVASSLFPEGVSKNRLRGALLGFRSALPRELMVGSGQTAIQVGMWRTANLLRLSRCVGQGGRVVLVEADPSAAENLGGFIRDRQLDNVTLVNKGAFSERGRQRFLLGDSPKFTRIEATDTRMPSERGATFLDEDEIEVDTIDNIAAELGIERVDYVEVTVNGLELPVLEGMGSLLAHTNRLWLAGCALAGENGEPTNVRTSKYLEERGFKTKIARRHVARQGLHPGQEVEQWGLLEGHVFAWRE